MAPRYLSQRRDAAGERLLQFAQEASQKGTRAVHTIEVKVRRGRQAERFNTALYRFLELRLSSVDELEGHIHVVTEPAGEWELKRLTLWSDEAAREFTAFWRNQPEHPHARPEQSWRAAG